MMHYVIYSCGFPSVDVSYVICFLFTSGLSLFFSPLYQLPLLAFSGRKTHTTSPHVLLLGLLASTPKQPMLVQLRPLKKEWRLGVNLT